ncbi:Hypothetical predicted protein [Octopus vulgaris]|uniref:Uncharacterized protein n=1 Tax=Octopus vulgaris TaxID=6645 RepID=A0AA36BG13_OCTVU|nr:Hypothetical predicted protein [Octopus vulgaris]
MKLKCPQYKNKQNEPILNEKEVTEGEMETQRRMKRETEKIINNNCKQEMGEIEKETKATKEESAGVVSPKKRKKAKSREMLQKATAEAEKTDMKDIELPETQEVEQRPGGAKTTKHPGFIVIIPFWNVSDGGDKSDTVTNRRKRQVDMGTDRGDTDLPDYVWLTSYSRIPYVIKVYLAEPIIDQTKPLFGNFRRKSSAFSIHNVGLMLAHIAAYLIALNLGSLVGLLDDKTSKGAEYDMNKRCVLVYSSITI